MKKLLSCILSLFMVFSMTVSGYAMENQNIESDIDIITIDADNTEDPIVVPQKKLKNTNLEGKEVIIEDGKVYVNGTRSASVAVYIAGVLAGWLIDGALIYYTGYSGAQLLAMGVNSLVNAWNTYRNMTEAYFNSYNTYLSSFKLSNGNQCVATSATTYACMFSA